MFEIDIKKYNVIFAINFEPDRNVKIQKKNEKEKFTCDLLYVVFNQMLYLALEMVSSRSCRMSC